MRTGEINRVAHLALDDRIVGKAGGMTDARALTLHLRGKWYGSYGTAPCPVCQPEGRKGQDALTLTDGSKGLLAHCKRLGCAFRDTLAAAGIVTAEFAPTDPAIIAQRETQRRAEAKRRAKQAWAIWNEAQPIAGTPAENYLRRRGISCDLPSTLRFHSEVWHGAAARRLPAMVALVEGGEGFAIHRTYLRTDGMGKADATPAKAMLGATAGGAVRLAGGLGPLVVAEGIETALSLDCGYLQARATIWAALSTSGVRGLHLPPNPARLTIAPDGDDPGREAANALAERAHALGWQVSLLPAPNGRDWNDTLQTKVVAS